LGCAAQVQSTAFGIPAVVHADAKRGAFPQFLTAFGRLHGSTLPELLELLEELLPPFWKHAWILAASHPAPSAHFICDSVA
jgi:hypothetical protein